MPVTIKVRKESMRFQTPLAAIRHLVPMLSKSGSGVDPLALGHASCVASAQAIRTNTKAGRRAVETLSKMVDAFSDGDIERGIRYAVVMGMDSMLTTTRGAGVSHPDTSAAFERAYDERRGASDQVLMAPLEIPDVVADADAEEAHEALPENAGAEGPPAAEDLGEFGFDEEFDDDFEADDDWGDDQ